MRAKDFVRFAVGENFYKPIRLVIGARAAIGRERELTSFIRDARFFKLLLGLAHAGNFRSRVDHAGDDIIINVPRLARNKLSHGNAFVFGFMREHRSVRTVAHRPYARDIRFIVIGFDKAAGVGLHPRRIKAKVFCERTAANTDQYDIRVQVFFFAASRRFGFNG